VSVLGRVSLGVLALGLVAVACKRARPETHATLEPPPKHVAPASKVRAAPRAPVDPEEPNRETKTPKELEGGEPVAYEPGSADRDPDNDFAVGPPDEVPDCEARLERASIRFRRATLPLRQPRDGVFTCGTSQAISYLEGPTKIRYNAAPVLTCGMALALGHFETVLQEEAEAVFGRRVTRIVQLGTYNCRKMSRFPSLVSEHSYANAIDIQSMTLSDGLKVSVRRHFGSIDEAPERPEAIFLRGLAQRLYDEALFSVVLTPYFDKNHADHFHLDLARYRVDGTRR